MPPADHIKGRLNMSACLDVNAEISSLIERWCDRRALGPLRIILNAWPMAMGLTELLQCH